MILSKSGVIHSACTYYKSEEQEVNNFMMFVDSKCDTIYGVI